jgi:type VI secretion system secreted protein Hcp
MSAQMFLKLDGIPGQSLVDGVAKEIECMSFSHGISHPMTYGPSNQARTAGRPSHQDFTITKYLDESSPKMIEHCNRGEDVKTATFTFSQSDGPSGKLTPLWVVTMTKAIISSISTGGSGGEIPMETLTLNYTTIKWEFKAQTEDATKKGTAASSWDLTKNEVGKGGK